MSSLQKTLSFIKHRAIESKIISWSLDYPNPKREPLFENDNIVLRGWILFKRKTLSESPCIYIPYSEFVDRKVILDKARPDVIEAIFGKKDNKNPQHHCGFNINIPCSQKKINIRIRVAEKDYLLKKVDLSEYLKRHTENNKLKVLQGINGWLFLDNDTNYSVDQHCGNLILKKNCLENWQAYINELTTISNDKIKKCAFLITPSKEEVMDRYHPYPKAETSLLKPILEKIPQHLLVYPLNELKELGDAAFLKTDTHWTHQGAKTAAISVANKLKLPEDDILTLLSSDKYTQRKHVGDLGNKLAEPQSAMSNFLSSFSFRNWVVYDNALPNFGRIIVTHYPKALTNSTCLIFGSSSSYSMFNYFCRFFSNMIFIHTAGNIDTSLITAISPNYLITQTNARFMIRPPVADYDVDQTIRDKINLLSEEQLTIQKKNVIIRDLEMIRALGLERWHNIISC